MNIYPRQNVYHAKNKSIDCTLLYGRAPLVYLLYAIPFTKVNQVHRPYCTGEGRCTYSRFGTLPAPTSDFDRCPGQRWVNKTISVGRNFSC